MSQGSRFHLIGNAPSSGSSILTRLLDASPYSISGPELEVFCNRKIFDFERFKQNPEKTSAFFTLQSTGIYPQYERLKHYGLDKEAFMALVAKAKSLQEFVDEFRLRYAAFREKDPQSIWFEKTPQNLNTIDLFLQEFPDSHFISIIRNPVFVYNSLRRRQRGGNLGAITTWLMYAAKMAPFFEHPRVKVLKYEELVESPYQIAKEVLELCSPDEIELDPLQIEQDFKTSEYANQATDGIQSWSIKSKTEIGNANKREIPKAQLLEIRSLMDYRLTDEYARLFGLEPISFRKALDLTGYRDQVEAQLEAGSIGNEYPEFPHSTAEDRKKRTTKWLREFARGNLSLSSLSVLKNPLVRV